ncbi:hypothetical protein ABW20_dc0102604 [Dactylellina cionopaga]|nr:hypothetical protein ABW20_dc0102604 [Dactylellina cionopaga]
MFEQILIRFRGGPISSNKDDDDESDDNSSDTATTPSASDGLVGRETLQLPLSRSLNYQLSPSPSLGRTPSPSASTSTSTSPSPSNSSPSSSKRHRSHSPRRLSQRHLITPNQSSSSITTINSAADMAKKKATRKAKKKKKIPKEQMAPNRGGTGTPPPQEEEREGRRGQKRKASEMATAQPNVELQVGGQPPPEKRMTRAESKRQDGEKRITTRSGRRLGVLEGEHIVGGSPSERASSLSKRKSPFLETTDHLLKRPTSRRSFRSAHDDDEEEEEEEEEDDVEDNVSADDQEDGHDDSNNGDHYAYELIISGGEDEVGGNLKVPTKSAGGGLGKGKQIKKPIARSSIKAKPIDTNQHHRNNQHHNKDIKMDDDAADASKRKLHALLRPGPDNFAFPWWHNDDWLLDEGPARKKKRLDADTEILILMSDEEDEEDPETDQQSSKKEEPRKLRSSTRNTQNIIQETDQTVLPAAVANAEKQLLALMKKEKFEKYEYPDEIKNAPLPTEDPLSDDRYLEAHNIKRDQEKTDHKKEQEKERRNFERYKQLLEQLEGAQNDEWMDILGVEHPENQRDLAKLLRKRDRLMDELKAVKRRYPVYRSERESIERGDYDPSFAGWLKRNNREPLQLQGRVIEKQYWYNDLEEESDDE